MKPDFMVYGQNRIGIYSLANNEGGGYNGYFYELKDHIGNVRATIAKKIVNNEVEADVLSWQHYYPYGMVMPNQNFTGSLGAYRFAFQGQERDREPNTEHEFFQLRTWDGRLGRWTSIDPYYQFNSPYLGMGNNPISGIDPDGGFWKELWNSIRGHGWNTGNHQAWFGNYGFIPKTQWTLDEVTVTASEAYKYPWYSALGERADNLAQVIGSGAGNFLASINPAYAIPNALVSYSGQDLQGNAVTPAQATFDLALSSIPGVKSIKYLDDAVKTGTGLVDDVAKQAKSWLGKDYKAITNKAGDNIFMSKDGLRKMRFDIKNPHGDAPHIHLEIFKNGKWKDAIPGTHRIYPKP